MPSRRKRREEQRARRRAFAPDCPTPDKQAYPGEPSANATSRLNGQHPYPCNCGHWHLSTYPRRRR